MFRSCRGGIQSHGQDADRLQTQATNTDTIKAFLLQSCLGTKAYGGLEVQNTETTTKEMNKKKTQILNRKKKSSNGEMSPC